MGTKNVSEHGNAYARARTASAIVDDMTALERMLAEGAFDSGPPRIGAEQEMLFVDDRLCPAPILERLLESLDDPGYTSELARFNLEANLTPRFLSGGSLRALHEELSQLCARARVAARNWDANLLLSGFLPTYEPCIAHLGQMAPGPRFAALNRGALAPRGGTLQLVIHGRDMLGICHDSIMMEGGSTSFQVHIQVPPESFAAAYNSALLVAAPVLAVCANSPLVFGHRLWHESRIALLEASSDLRSSGQLRRPGTSRTCLGDCWVERSVLEIFARDLCHFEPIFEVDEYPRSTRELRSGRIPSLRALSAFNGTVYRWMRPCFGVTAGRPHLRIENRILPAGPTIVDEVANAALWLGLMSAMPAQLGNGPPRLEFAAAEENFHDAARSGLHAQLHWLDGERIGARELLMTRLVPLAREGLHLARVSPSDIDRYLDIILRRLETRRTGAQWMLDAFDGLPSTLPRRRKSWRVTEAMLDHMWSGEPIHEWPTILPSPAIRRVPSVAAVLRTEVIAVPPESPALLAKKQLEWSGASHLVVETAAGDFVGVLSREDLEACDAMAGSPKTVADFLPADAAPVIAADLPIDRALAQLRAAGRACGVILQGGHVSGLVYEGDLAEALTCPDGAPSGRVDADRCERDREAGAA